MSITKQEHENLEIIVQDVSITILKNLSNFDKSILEYMEKLLPFFVVFYFKILKHDAKNKNWAHKDELFIMNNIFNILKNILEIHTGHEKFENILIHLKENSYFRNRYYFSNIIKLLEEEKTLKSNESINNKNKIINKSFFVLLDQNEIINNIHINELEYISKNNLYEIIIFVFVRPIMSENFSKISQSGINFYQKENLKPVIQDHKLNQKINNLGFDVLVIDGSDMIAVDNATIYAKSLKKPTMILINTN